MQFMEQVIKPIMEDTDNGRDWVTVESKARTILEQLSSHYPEHVS